MEKVKEEDILEFCNFTAADPQTARLWLQRYPVEQAVGEYFDKNQVLPPESQIRVESWDEGLFSGERNVPFGPENKNDSDSLQIVADELPGQQHRNSPDIEGWRASVTNGEEQTALILRSDQQTGVTDLGQPHWSTSTERHPPDAKYRRRKDDGTPIVLRPSGDNLLAPLLTILHKIPKAREALIGRQELLPDYDAGPDWWDGKPKQEFDQSDGSLRVWAETQRLMAFQDGSNRAYASLASLEAAIDYLTGAATRDTVNNDQAFLEAFSEYSLEEFPDLTGSRIFISELTSPKPDGELEETKLTDMLISYDEAVADTGGSVLDIVENTLAESVPEGATAYLTACADVLIMFIEPSMNGKPTGARVPETFHSGRWFERQTSPELQSVRNSKHEVQQKLREIDMKYKRLGTTPSLKGGEEILVTKVLKDSIAQLKARQTTNEASDEGESRSKDILQNLEKLQERLESKVAALEQAKKDALQEIRSLSTRLNDLRLAQEEQQASEGKGAKYSLRGLALSPTKYFVSVGVSNPEDLLTETEWEWWRVEPSWHTPAGWTTSETFNLQSSRTSVAVATALAKEATTKIMLVYATDEAMAENATLLPEQLQRFVDMDNAAFEKECSPWEGNSPSSTIAEKSENEQGDLQDVQMTEVPAQEGMIRLESNEDEGPPRYSWREAVRESFRPVPPKLPPRLGSSGSGPSLHAPRPVTPSGSKRKNVLSKVKGALSRSKSRERSRDRDQNDLLIDNEEQSHGIPAMNVKHAGTTGATGATNTPSAGTSSTEKGSGEGLGSTDKGGPSTSSTSTSSKTFKR